jgi:YggT family protein
VRAMRATLARTATAVPFLRPTLCRRHAKSVSKCGTAGAISEVAALCLDGQQAGLIASVLKPTLAVVEFLFIMRIIMSWDPAYNTGDKLPWAIFYKPTEPVLAPTRRVIQPIGGVDISPIVWTFILSLMNEILLGPQGILVLIERQGGL